jgi:proline iminopeptidase
MPPMPAVPLDLDALPWQALSLPDGAVMAWCEGGDPHGVPVVVLHGGPGGRTRAPTLQWWSGLPVRWIAFDQRGCGHSTPRGTLQGNDLATLIDDVERLRAQLGIDRWAVAGGSWGGLLGVAYAQQRPQAVAGLFLRSVFSGSVAARRRYIAPWRDWLGPAGLDWLGVRAGALEQWLCQGATALCDAGSAAFVTMAQDAALAHAWAGFDAAQSGPGGVPASGARWQPPSSEATALDDWAIFLHHAGQGFGVGATGVVAPADMPGPTWLVHGEADAVCDPADSATLARAWPAAGHVIVPGGAHAMSHPPMAAALQAAAQAWVVALQVQAGTFQRSLR